MKPIQTQRDTFAIRLAVDLPWKGPSVAPSDHPLSFRPFADGDELSHAVSANNGYDSNYHYPGVAAFKGDNMVGHLEWYGPKSPQPNQVAMVKVHPEHRRQGIGDALFEQGQKINPDLHHSPLQTSDGKAWTKKGGSPFADYTAWYHVSPHELPEGTELTPGGGKSPTKNFYKPDDPRPNHVWLEKDPARAKVYADEIATSRRNDYPYILPKGPDPQPYTYEVDPSEEPQPWEGTGREGWTVPSATIKKRAGSPFADYTAWCMSNHFPMDTQSLGRFVQQENLPAQVYRDLSAFMAGMRYMD